MIVTLQEIDKEDIPPSSKSVHFRKLQIFDEMKVICPIVATLGVLPGMFSPNRSQ